ncbi:MAG: HAD family hydrolase [Candidatus Thermoplasmatota archaeon]|nr:HAD family hydrolase [Candidatus Thermoplasmatota archaeon]
MARDLCVDAVVFDLGNTLLPFGTAEHDEFIERWYSLSGSTTRGISFDLFLEAYQEMVDEEWERRRTSSWESDPLWRSKELLSSLQKSDSDTEGMLPAIVTSHTDAFSECLRFPAPSLEAMEDLLTMRGPSGRKVRLALVSNAMDGAAIRRSLKRSGADLMLDPIVISQEVGVTKPHEVIFKIATDALGIDPRSCAYVGDRFEIDIIGAGRAGMVPVYTRQYETPGEPLKGVEVQAPTIRSLDELPIVLGG